MIAMTVEVPRAGLEHFQIDVARPTLRGIPRTSTPMKPSHERARRWAFDQSSPERLVDGSVRPPR